MRDFRLAWLLAALGAIVLYLALWLALNGGGSKLDMVLLWLALAVHLVALLIWAIVPGLWRWAVAGYGLILAASGLGFAITAPADAAAQLALVGMGLTGLLTVVAAALRRPTTMGHV